METELQYFNRTGFKYYKRQDAFGDVVFIHGVGLNQDMWEQWLPIFGKNYNVLTYDLLGHNHSYNPIGPRTGLDFSNQLIELVDHLDIKKFSLIGFSIGAVISQIVSSLHYQRLNHVVFLHSVYQRTEAQCEAVRCRYVITKNEGPMATVELAIVRWFSQQYIQENPQKIDQIRKIFAKHSNDGYLKAYYFFSYAEEEMKEYPVNHVNIPALVITGSGETGSTPGMSEALAQDLPNSELIINPGHFHMAPVEHADILANQVLSFLQQYESCES